MSSQLVLSDSNDTTQKDIGENIFLANLPSNYNVYLFYYPGAMGNEELETNLRQLGDLTGENLFVNIGKLNDPNYNKIAQAFEIKKLPVIVVTATSDLASPPSSQLNSYIKIDNPKLLTSSDKIMELLQKLFNLYVSGDIAEALKEIKKDDRKMFFEKVSKVVSDALKGVWSFFDERDIKISILEGKFELKRH